jgi:hypothetical protein
LGNILETIDSAYKAKQTEKKHVDEALRAAYLSDTEQRKNSDFEGIFKNLDKLDR